jgi:hypothetical protein
MVKTRSKTSRPQDAKYGNKPQAIYGQQSTLSKEVGYVKEKGGK